MNLTSSMILYHLKKDYDIFEINHIHTNQEYTWPVMYEENILLTNLVVVGTPENLLKLASKQNRKSAALLFITNSMPAFSVSNIQFPIFCIKSENIACHEILNTLQYIFNIFNQWEQNLLKIILRENQSSNGYLSLVKCSEHIVQTPFAIINLPENTYVAFSDDYYKICMEPYGVTGDWKIPWVFLNDSSYRIYSTTYQKKHDVYTFSFADTTHEVMGLNVFYGERYVGLVGLLITQPESLQYYEDILIRLHYYVQKLYQILKSFSPSAKKQNPISEFINSILKSGETPDESICKNILSSMGWKTESPLCIILFQENQYTDSWTDHNTYAKNMGIELVYKWKGIVDFQFENTSYILVNEDIFQEKNKQNLHQTLSLFVRENMLYAGISRDFFSLSQCAEAVQQAQYALQYGVQVHNNRWIFYFDDIVIPFILDNSHGKLNKHSICSHKLLQLQAYDEVKGTDYCHTIFTYILCKFNVSETASKLCIQRTSLQYRIKRIKEICNLDFDSIDELMYIYFSFLLLKS